MPKLLVFAFCLVFSFNLQADDRALLASFYSTIMEKHAEPVSAERLATGALEGLSAIDRELLFANGKEMIYLYYKKQQAGLWHKPKENGDVKAWSDLTLKVLETAVKKSPRAAERDFELLEKVMAAAAESLEDNSHYYSELDPEPDSQPKPIRSFGRRMFGNVLYLKIGTFNTATRQNIVTALNDYPQAQGLILDLRGNRGGLLTAAIDVAALFIDGGIVASVKGRDESSVKYYNAEDNDGFSLPIVILIDGNTASSAEVVAAALMEQAQAKLVGTNSFGKGSIQEMYSFANGGRLALTTAHFYTPSGQKIDKIGLIPDYCTYHAVENIRIDRATAFTNLKCGQESRENMKADIELAVSILR